VIHSFGNKLTEALWSGHTTKDTRRFDNRLVQKVQDKLDMLEAAADLLDLLVPPGNRLESLQGNLKDFHSIRVNDQWRLIFKWVDNAVCDVALVDYH
jgi:toxin HigB-1